MSRKAIVCLVVLLFGMSMSLRIKWTPIQIDQLDKDIAELEEKLKLGENSVKNMKPLGADLQDEKLKFVCTRGKNPQKLTFTEYIEEFKAGPCSPVIVIPGITGSKLKLKIDCKTLKDKSPHIFNSCGWTSCDYTSMGTLFHQVPRKEYNIWVPDFSSPFSLINVDPKTRPCLGNIIEMPWDEGNSRIDNAHVPGIQIVPLGLTESSRQNSKCGFDAITNLVGDTLSKYLPNKVKAFELLRTQLENAGFMNGLTMQALPYDWRKTFYHNEVGQKFENIAKKIVVLTGKKPTVIAHSYGNLNFLNVISQFSPLKKKHLINRYIALAAPFLGSSNSLFSLIGGNSKYYFMEGYGIDFQNGKKILQTPSFYDLLPRLNWNLFKDANWMKSIHNRVSLESKKQHLMRDLPPEEDIVTKVFPKSQDDCFTHSWDNDRSKKCLSGLSEYKSFGSVNGEKMTINNIGDILARYSLIDKAKETYDYETSQGNYDELKNPGVPTTIMYSNIIPTIFKGYYLKDPTLVTKGSNPTFCKPDSTENEWGDGTVMTTSAIAPGIKWAYEFDKKEPNTYPVTFAEICSTYNARSSVQIDGKNPEDNNYHGVGCNCVRSSGDCSHTSLLSDEGVLNYLINSLADNQPVEDFESKDEKFLSKFVKECSLLNNS